MTNFTAPVRDRSTRTRPLELISSPRQSALGGLLVRQYRWGLSRWAKFSLVMVALVIAVTVFFGIYPFLAITQRVNGDMLVVEGWIHPYAIDASVKELKNPFYQRVDR